MRSALDSWLDSVTGVFPHDTGARLRRELEAHAEETVQTLHAEGHPAQYPTLSTAVVWRGVQSRMRWSSSSTEAPT
ncbi:hypothetical protein DEFR109230_16535 [Deinococcus frigens]